ncbi:MAG: NADH-quinone oxidoreductase subunit N, partial [Myxococcales bacterium]|nr:NADH-quinone oxidoreductase subunit N [Myxococcales bacterium]
MALAFILSPLLIIGIGALMLMLAEAFGPKHNRAAGLALGSTIVFGAGFAFSVGTWLYGVEDIPERELLAPWLVIDRFSLFFDGLLCLGGALASLLAGGYLREHEMERGEFYSLMLFSTIGAMMVAAAGDALIVFLGLETMSLGAYAL